MTGDDIFKQIVELRAQGLNMSEIARRLSVSRKTLYKHWGRGENGAQEQESPTPASPAVAESKTVRRGAPKGNKYAVGNRGGNGGPPGNKNALITGEYETLWDVGLSEREQRAMREAWSLPTLEQLNRQLGLLDVRIGRTLERLRQYREALANGVEMQLDTRSQTDGNIGTMEMNSTTDRLVHTREIIERTEQALDRMTTARGQLLARRATIEMQLLKRGMSDGPGGEQQARATRRDLSHLSDEELSHFESILMRHSNP